MAVLWPGFALVALTAIVMVEMYRRRLGQMRRDRIPPQAVATSVQSSRLLTDSMASDNFRNLLELPVLFYAALVFAYLGGQFGADVLALAWSFVGLRVVHCMIHCIGNRVVPRFLVFIAGAVVLFALWVRLALGMSGHV